MTSTRTRGGRATLTDQQQTELDAAKRAAEETAAAYRETAGRIGAEVGWGGASAVARHVGWTPAHVATLVKDFKTRQHAAHDGSAAA